MKLLRLGFTLAIVLMFILSGSASAAVQKLSLPEGDEVEGRRVFEELRCFTCHRVLGDERMPKPVASKPAPNLGLRTARYKEDFIADSIVFPSHAIAPGSLGMDMRSGLSRMGDFSDVMSVRQLADVVAYLKSLDEDV